MTLYDFERYFNRNIKELENDDAVTLTGYVLNHDRIPCRRHYESRQL